MAIGPAFSGGCYNPALHNGTTGIYRKASSCISGLLRAFAYPLVCGPALPRAPHAALRKRLAFDLRQRPQTSKIRPLRLSQRSLSRRRLLQEATAPPTAHTMRRWFRLTRTSNITKATGEGIFAPLSRRELCGATFA